MIDFRAFRGVVMQISDHMIGSGAEQEHCFKLMNVVNENGEIVNFVISPDTYFVDQEMIHEGDQVTGYYNGNAPVILIYPPQYPALVVVKEKSYQNVKVGFFNEQLVSSDGQLQLNLSPYTQVVMTNAQAFTATPTNRNLIVIYGASTRSIPAQTVPYKIIVWCSEEG